MPPTRRNAYGFVSATIFAVALLGCGPKDAGTVGTGGASPVTLEVKATPTTGKKLPTVEELAKEVGGADLKEWVKPRVPAEVYFVRDGYTVLGFKNLAADDSGKPFDITFVGISPDGKLGSYEGKPDVYGRMLRDPFPADKPVDREDIRKAVLGRKPDEVKRLLGKPEATAEQFGTITWTYPKRSKDDTTGKDDDEMAVTFRSGYADGLTFR